jgi:PPM family protein phosphatase
MRHRLTSVLGGEGGQVALEIRPHPLQDGDRILLCTDGLTEMLDEPTIASIISSSPHPQKTCQTLVEQALNAGGTDNVTVLMGHYSLDEEI